MINLRDIKLTLIILIFSGLSACADLSMYNQAPAPVGHEGTLTSPNYPEQEVVISALGEPSNDGVEVPVPIQQQPSQMIANPAVVALLDSSFQQQKAGNLSIAASTLERAVRISPRNAKVWHELALLRFQQANYNLALSLASKSNLLAANDRLLRYKNWQLIANSKLKLGDRNGASEAKSQADSLR